MKKILLLSLVFVFMFAGMSSAAIKVGLYAPIGSVNSGALYTSTAWYTHPALVITPGNNKDVNYDIIVGYSSAGVGEDIDANVGLLLGGTWWIGQAGSITYGPTIIYYSQGIADDSGTVDTSGKVVSDKASDNTITSLNFIFSVKTPLIASLDLRADVVVYSSVSGQHYGDDIKEANQMLNTIQLGLQYSFWM